MTQPAHSVGEPLDKAGMTMPADWPALGPPGRTAIVFEGRATSYGELDRQASAFIAVARGLGVKPGDRIAYLGLNNDVYFPVLFGALRLGAVLLPLNWRCTAPELAFILGDAEPALLIHDAQFGGVAGQAVPAGCRAVETEALRALIAAAEPQAWSAPPPEDLAMLMYTSGTTGKPKGVTMTHAMFAIVRHVERTSPQYEGWDEAETILSPMPNFHIGGLSWMLIGLSRGFTCHLTADPSPGNVLKMCVEHGIERTFLVPVVVRALLEEMVAQGAALPRLKEIHYGASPMDVALLEACIAKIGCQFMHHYGMTEACGSITRLGPAEHDPARPHLLKSIGTIQPGAELQIRRPDLSVADRGEAGEIWLKSPTITPGYWKRPEASAEAIVDGWYRSGDGGTLDQAGYLYLTDRIKEMIISGGENIYPVEVEAALRTHPAVLDVAVFGLPHEKWGETVAAAIEWRQGQGAEEAELDAHARGLIAGYKLPRRYFLGVALPRTASGKIQRGEARKQVTA